MFYINDILRIFLVQKSIFQNHIFNMNIRTKNVLKILFNKLSFNILRTFRTFFFLLSAGHICPK